MNTDVNSTESNGGVCVQAAQTYQAKVLLSRLPGQTEIMAGIYTNAKGQIVLATVVAEVIEGIVSEVPLFDPFGSDASKLTRDASIASLTVAADELTSMYSIFTCSNEKCKADLHTTSEQASLTEVGSMLHCPRCGTENECCPIEEFTEDDMVELMDLMAAASAGHEFDGEDWRE